jgi:hypothetical protein
MKPKLALFILTILSLQTSGNAQIRVGLFGGRHNANMNVSHPDSIPLDFTAVHAGGYGGLIEFGANETVGLRLAPMYLQKGTKQTFRHSVLGDISSRLRFSYFEIPVLIRLAFLRKNFSPYVLAGPSVGYLLQAKQEYDKSAPLPPTFPRERNIKDQSKSWDWSMRYGGGLNFRFGAAAFFMQADYGLGLAKINSFSGMAYKSRGWYYSAGLTFSFGDEPSLTDVAFEKLKEIRKSEISAVMKSCVPRLAELTLFGQLALVIYDGFQNREQVCELFLEAGKEALVKGLVKYLEKKNRYGLARAIEWHDCVCEVAQFARKKVRE